MIEDWSLIWRIFALFGMWTGMSLWAVKWMITHYLNSSQQRDEERFGRFESRIDTLLENNKKLEQEHMALKAELPEKYLRREDWVRYITVIDAKLDALAERVANTNLQLAGLVNKMGRRDER